MTNKSLSSHKQPMLLRPAGKDYLWGGSRLKTEYYKDIPMEPLAETWECSTHPDGPSVVASGEYEGCTLAEVIKLHPKWLGTHPKQWEPVAERLSTHAESSDVIPESSDVHVDSANLVLANPGVHSERCDTFSEIMEQDWQSGGIPVLIKLIDAKKDLSVQVHPDDAYAWAKEGQPGKTEMWYVLDAEPGASLIYGFAQDMTKDKILQSLQEGRFMDYLQRIPVRKNDVFFIEPGTIHAIGGGVLVAEIQECSNVTYRVYDYDRVDKNGEKRPLHLQQALDVLKLAQQPEVRRQMRVMRYQPGSASEVLCRCEYFQVDRVLVSSRFACKVEGTSFQVLLVLEGELEVRPTHGRKVQEMPFETELREKGKCPTETAHGKAVAELCVGKGQCIFLPADCGEIEVLGRGQLLRVFC